MVTKTVYRWEFTGWRAALLIAATVTAVVTGVGAWVFMIASAMGQPLMRACI